MTVPTPFGTEQANANTKSAVGGRYLTATGAGNVPLIDFSIVGGADQALLQLDIAGNQVADIISVPSHAIQSRSYNIIVRMVDNANPGDFIDHEITVVPTVRSSSIRTGVNRNRATLDVTKVVGLVNTEAGSNDRSLMETYFDQYGISYDNIFEHDFGLTGSHGLSQAYSRWIGGFADFLETKGARRVVVGPYVPHEMNSAGISGGNVSVDSMAGGARVWKQIIATAAVSELDDLDVAQRTAAAHCLTQADAIEVGSKITGFAKSQWEIKVKESGQPIVDATDNFEYWSSINGNNAQFFREGTGHIGVFYDLDWEAESALMLPYFRLAWAAPLEVSTVSGVTPPTDQDIIDMVANGREMAESYQWSLNNLPIVGMLGRREAGAGLGPGTPMQFVELAEQLGFQNIIYGYHNLGAAITLLEDCATKIGKFSKYEALTSNPTYSFTHENSVDNPDTQTPTYRSTGTNDAGGNPIERSFRAHNGTEFPIPAWFYQEAGFSNISFNDAYPFLTKGSSYQAFQVQKGGVYSGITSYPGLLARTWIREGGSCVLGGISEPSTVANIPNPIEFLGYLADGHDMAMAHMLSCAYSAYTTAMPQGDLLAAPFAQQATSQEYEMIIQTIKHPIAETAAGATGQLGVGLSVNAAGIMGNPLRHEVVDVNGNVLMTVVGLSCRQSMPSNKFIYILVEPNNSTAIANDTNVDWPATVTLNLKTVLGTLVLNSSTPWAKSQVVGQTSTLGTEYPLVLFTYQYTDAVNASPLHAQIDPSQAGVETYTLSADTGYTIDSGSVIVSLSGETFDVTNHLGKGLKVEYEDGGSGVIYDGQDNTSLRAWAGKAARGTDIDTVNNRYTFTAVGGEGVVNTTLGYEVGSGNLEVYINGVLQTLGATYTESGGAGTVGTNVTFSPTLTASDEIMFINTAPAPSAVIPSGTEVIVYPLPEWEFVQSSTLPDVAITESEYTIGLGANTFSEDGTFTGLWIDPADPDANNIMFTTIVVSGGVVTTFSGAAEGVFAGTQGVLTLHDIVGQKVAALDTATLTAV